MFSQLKDIVDDLNNIIKKMENLKTVKKQEVQKKIKNKKINFEKPFLKWLGGKTKLIYTITNLFPKEMNNYYELFLGGGSVLLALLNMKNQNKISIKGNIYAFDTNEILINLYKNIKNNKDEIFNLVNKYKTEYNNIDILKFEKKKKRQLPKHETLEDALKSKESYYYWIRKQFNIMLNKPKNESNNLNLAALFWFLNKTCFRGVYRMGKNGFFNLPFGSYK